jgi:cytoskeleton protein RodZ
MTSVAETPHDPEPAPLALGQLLATERERQGLARADVAQRLHMSAWQVEALEKGDYERLPKGTFLRGFVRNYTKLLGLNSQAALDALAHVAPRGPAPGIVVPSQNIRFDPLGERLSSPYVKAWGVAGVAFLLAMAGVYWWIFVRPAPPAPAAAPRKAASTQPVPQNLAAAPVSAPEPVAPPREAPKMEAPGIEPSPPAPTARAEPPASAPAAAGTNGSARSVKPPDVLPVTATAAPATPRAPGTRTLTLRFKGSAWVEIKDRSGKVLLSKLNDPGSEAEVSGRPPFNVVVGNAPDVTLLYDDRVFPLEPHTRVAVARFTLE